MIDRDNIVQNKLNILLSFLFLIPIFFEIKLNYKISFFYLKTSYFFIILIFLIYLFKFHFFTKKNFFFAYVLLFFLSNLLINLNEIEFGLYFKQLFAVLIFTFIFFNFYYSNFINIKFFLKLYLFLSLISVYLGFLGLCIHFILNLEIFNTSFLNMINERIFHFLFENKNSYRLTGLSSEPATLGITLLPALIIILSKQKINWLNFSFIIASILATQSIYAYLGLFLILFHQFHKRKSVVLLLLISIVSISIQSNSIKMKTIESFLNLKYVLNQGWEEDKYKADVSNIIYNWTYNDLNNYKLKLNKEKDNTRLIILEKILDQNQHKLNTKISNIDKKIFIQNQMYVNLTYINASTCSYLYNAFVTGQGLKYHLFTGIGLGNYVNIYNQFSDRWKFKNSVYSNCYLLNKDDGKTIFLRILSEFGIVVFLIFVLYVTYIYFKFLFNKNYLINCFYICFLLKILQLGSYTDIATYLFFTIAMKLNNESKENV